MTGKSFTGGTSGSVNFVYDAASQGIASSDSTSGTVYEDRWYRMGGVNMWHYSNRYNLAAGDASIVGSRYTVKGGDTLQSVALTLWGDGSLWYKLAEANGLSAGAALSEGQSLIVPSGVWRNSQNAATYTPYDAGRFIGPVDASPSYPAPPKSAKCGVFGQILSTLVAIAASQFLGPVFGNLVSQGFNMVIGIQSKFSWKSLGMSVASAVVTAGMSGAFAGVQSAFLQGALQTATASALTQGIGVATGLQKKFDFAGIAAAGVAGGVSSWAGARLGERISNVDKTVWRNGDLSKNNAFLANSAGAIAEAATRSAIKGNSFGDNLLASLPSVIGRAALDGAGAKSILGDGWLGTALADPGSVLPKGWITNAANSVISTVGNVVADMVRGNAQGGGGSPWRNGHMEGFRWVSDNPNTAGNMLKLATTSHYKSAGPLFRLSSGNVVYQTAAGKIIVYDPSERRETPSSPNTPVHKPLPKASVDDRAERLAAAKAEAAAKARVERLAAAHAREAPITERLNEDQRLKSAMPAAQPAEIQLAVLTDTDFGPWATNVSASIAEFGKGVVFGDFAEGGGWAMTAGQIIGGFNPLADARDFSAAAYDVWQGKKGSTANLFAAGVGFIPIIGDAAKHGIKHSDELFDLAKKINADNAGKMGGISKELTDASKSALAKAGRAGKQQRLRELAQDDKASSVDRGWIQQELNSIARGNRTSIRVPPGNVLAHRRGFEAKKGFSYNYSDLQNVELHKLQHKYEGY